MCGFCDWAGQRHRSMQAHMSPSVSLRQVRRITTNTFEGLCDWFTDRTRLFEMPRPEQQLLFEMGVRLRDSLRSVAADPDWDGVLFDASSASDILHPVEAVGRRPHLVIDTRRLVTTPAAKRRTLSGVDVAICLRVLRSAPETVLYDENGSPRHLGYRPTSLRAQGRLLDEDVALLETLAKRGCDGYLFVVYSNAAKRRTPIDKRDVASWAAWRSHRDTLWSASRHFRARVAQ